MALIREDKYGLYAKVGGYYMRPRVNERYNWLDDTVSTHKVGDKVKARHLASTGLGMVGTEQWYTHGSTFRTSSESEFEKERIRNNRIYETTD